MQPVNNIVKSEPLNIDKKRKHDAIEQETTNQVWLGRHVYRADQNRSITQKKGLFLFSDMSFICGVKKEIDLGCKEIDVTRNRWEGFFHDNALQKGRQFVQHLQEGEELYDDEFIGQFDDGIIEKGMYIDKKRRFVEIGKFEKEDDVTQKLQSGYRYQYNENWTLTQKIRIVGCEEILTKNYSPPKPEHRFSLPVLKSKN